jgi:hypothetical protein
LLLISSLVLPAEALAQQPETLKPAALKADTVDAKEPFRITALRVGIDLNPWIQNFTNKEKKLLNLHTRVEAGDWGLLLDINRSETGVQDSTTYTHAGNYVRLGVVRNLLKKDDQGNLLYLGAGYGRSWFSEAYSANVVDPIYGNTSISQSQNNLRGGWLEAMFGIQARIWQQLFAGYELRLKFAPHFTDNDVAQLYQVPGYGRASDNSQVGFSYYLLYRIPLGGK